MRIGARHERYLSRRGGRGGAGPDRQERTMIEVETVELVGGVQTLSAENEAMSREINRLEARITRFERFAAAYHAIVDRTYYTNPEAHPEHMECYRLYQEAMKL